ncbi:PadR family transcriptional regulator [Phenylobacterium sp.]|uniref:PadR family transcriptional regulator n=1 Tax=Phenylobacterium sp. TaxID=1871053 RepID=UPI002F95317D
MTRTRRPSPAAQRLLAALLATSPGWRHGYDLTKATRVGAGTLYPLLDRWARDGLLESEWLPSETPGRPARHAYRLTSKGMAFAHQWTADAAPCAHQGLAT